MIGDVQPVTLHGTSFRELYKSCASPLSRSFAAHKSPPLAIYINRYSLDDNMVTATQFRGSETGDVVQTTFALPEIQPDEVLVKVTHSGLCGSDIHMIKLPLVLGHEGWHHPLSLFSPPSLYHGP
jgi:hypothetical protein